MGLRTSLWGVFLPVHTNYAVSALFFQAKASVNFYKFKTKIPTFPVGPAKESGIIRGLEQHPNGSGCDLKQSVRSQLPEWSMQESWVFWTENCYKFIDFFNFFSPFFPNTHSAASQRPMRLQPDPYNIGSSEYRSFALHPSWSHETVTRNFRKIALFGVATFLAGPGPLWYFLSCGIFKFSYPSNRPTIYRTK